MTREMTDFCRVERTPAEIYIARAFFKSNDLSFARNAPPASLLNYDVDLWDLYRSYHRAMADGMHHLSQHMAQRLAKMADAEVDAETMAIAVGRDELYILQAEKRCREKWPGELVQSPMTREFLDHLMGRNYVNKAT